MQIERISFDKIPQFSNRDRQYQTNPETFSDFIKYMPTEDGLLQAARDRKSFTTDRNLLVSVLEEHYKSFKIEDLQKENLLALADENTFTIITAHQPCLFTGPLYYVTKLFSAVNLSKRLNNNNEGFKFVPVFINGSEDHDFEEVASLNIYNKSVSWQTEQTGPVGRMELDGLEKALEDLVSVMGTGETATTIKEKIKACLYTCNNYNDFVFKFVNVFFGYTGILVLTMDDAALKKAFIPIMKKEILEEASLESVQNTQAKIEELLGYKAQAFARPINLFYLSDGNRGRIERDGEGFIIIDSNKRFTEDELMVELEAHPESFSPNVVLRPLFQEFILPNVAYVGGGGELAYWMERKQQFQDFGIFFPTLIRRNSLMIISKSQNQMLSKVGFSIDEIFALEDDLIRTYLERKSHGELDLSLENEQISKIMNDISEKAEAIDPTLKNAVLAEANKIGKQVEQIESRIRRSLKQQEETQVNQIKTLKSKLFAGNGLQERTDNFFQFYLSMGEKLTEQFESLLDPLDKEFLDLVDE